MCIGSSRRPVAHGYRDDTCSEVEGFESHANGECTMEQKRSLG